MTPRSHPAQALKVNPARNVGESAFPRKEGQLAAGEWLIERLRLGARVLDVGCGTGVPTARQLADAGCDVTGIDISAEILEVARREVSAATFLRLDVTDGLDLDLQRGGFDAVVAFFSLLTLPCTEIPAVLRRLYDLLAPGGYFLLSTFDTDLRDIPIRPGAIDYPGAELRALVSEAGFEVLDLRHLSYARTAPRRAATDEVQLFVYCRRPGRGPGRR
jgi:SAM-dependent methyltransferase